MARWRDVKQGKITKQKIKKQNTQPSFCDAPLSLRFKAFITDSFMIMMPIMYFVTYVIIGTLQEFAKQRGSGWLYILSVHFIITLLFWYFKSQTPGLKAYDLKIVDSTSGEKVTLISLINRYIFTTLSIMFIVPLFIPYFNKQRKTLQDIVSGSCIKQIS